MRVSLASTFLVAMMLAGSGCEEAQQPAGPPTVEPGPAPDGTDPTDPDRYPPAGEGAHLMPQPGQTPALNDFVETVDRDPLNPPSVKGTEADAVNGSDTLMSELSRQDDLTSDVLGGGEFATPALLEDSPKLEFDAPIDFDGPAADFRDLGSRYG